MKDIEKMMKMSESMIDVAWNMTVYDIEGTLRSSIKRLFRDKGATKEDKKTKAQGLLMMGKIFKKYGVASTKEGLKDLKEKLSG